MLTEFRTYRALEDLQRHAILKLKGAGYTPGGLAALMTELSGSAIEVEKLNNEECKEIRTKLADIHRHHFLHGDISANNILIQHCHDGFKIRFIDFAFSKIISNPGERDV